MLTVNNERGGELQWFVRADFFCLKGRSLVTKNETEVVKLKNMRRVTPRQLAYIQQLRKKEGKDSREIDEEPNCQEASKIITELTENSKPAGQMKALDINEVRLGLALKECYRYFRRYEKDIHDKYRDYFKQDVVKTYQLFTEIAQELGQSQGLVED